MVDLNELRNNYILIILVLVSYQRVSWSREQGAESREQRAESRPDLRAAHFRRAASRDSAVVQVTSPRVTCLLCYVMVPWGNYMKYPSQKLSSNANWYRSDL